ncbi:hypothetical protein V2H46_18290, partial [Vibrio cholerae]|nr:hypothetical protein [Vibrio cholerae]
SQRAAFLLCVGFCGYGVMRKVSSRVGCPLSGRYAIKGNVQLLASSSWTLLTPKVINFVHLTGSV